MLADTQTPGVNITVITECVSYFTQNIKAAGVVCENINF